MLYSAYNNDFGFRVYEDETAYATLSIKQQQSAITRADVGSNYSGAPQARGGRRKKRTKKKARRKRRKRSKRKYK